MRILLTREDHIVNPGDPNQPYWGQGEPTSAGQPPVTPPVAPPVAPPPGTPPPTAQWGLPPATGPMNQQTQWGAVPGPMPAPVGSFDLRARLPEMLLVLSSTAGLITYFMGFVSWVTVNPNVSEDDLQRWADQYTGRDVGIPGFASYEVVLNPGKFLILLGAIAIAAALVIVPRFRRAVPLLAVLAAGGWLALLSGATTIATGPVTSMGAGAIVALVFGFFQFALLIGAAVVGGLRER